MIWRLQLGCSQNHQRWPWDPRCDWEFEIVFRSTALPLSCRILQLISNFRLQLNFQCKKCKTNRRLIPWSTQCRKGQKNSKYDLLCNSPTFSRIFSENFEISDGISITEQKNGGRNVVVFEKHEVKCQNDVMVCISNLNAGLNFGHFCCFSVIRHSYTGFACTKQQTFACEYDSDKGAYLPFVRSLFIQDKTTTDSTHLVFPNAIYKCHRTKF